MQVVCVCARFQANPKKSHLITVKRILKYLKGTTSFGLWYPSGASPSLLGYFDVDYAGCQFFWFLLKTIDYLLIKFF